MIFDQFVISDFMYFLVSFAVSWCAFLFGGVSAGGGGVEVVVGMEVMGLSLSFDALLNFKILTWQNKIPHQHISL